MNLTLTTERLLLRPLAMEDADLGLETLGDPEVMKYFGTPYTPQQVHDQMPVFVRRCAGGRIGIWCVADMATGEKLGTAVLLPLPIEERDTNWDLVQGDALPDAEIEVGYTFKTSAWGKGYATEACRRMLRFAFEDAGLAEVVAVTAPENSVSQKVLRKSGLRYEGTRRAYSYDCPGFRITRRQWLHANPGPVPA